MYSASKLAATVADLSAAAAAGGGDFKAAICIFLRGGCDTYNTYVPIAQRAQYAAARPNIALPSGDVRSLDGSWGLSKHYCGGDTTGLLPIWQAGKMAVLRNIGVLQVPTSKSQYAARSVPLPRQLMSHNDQQRQWETLPITGQVEPTGWFGRLGEMLRPFNAAAIAGSEGVWSPSGTPEQNRGLTLARSNVSATGAASFIDAGSATMLTLVNGIAGLRSAAAGHSSAVLNHLGNTVAATTAAATSLNAAFTAAGAVPAGADTPLTALAGNTLAPLLRGVIRALTARTQLGQRRQMFLVNYPSSWDDHANLLAAHNARIRQVGDAIAALWTCLGVLGLQNNVVIFTESDFGRALMENGSLGTDHGWGAFHCAIGGSVAGGMYGTDPLLSNDGPDDIGQGRLIPTTSVDQLAGTIAQWMGVPTQHLSVIAENLPAFASPTLGFLG